MEEPALITNQSGVESTVVENGRETIFSKVFNSGFSHEKYEKTRFPRILFCTPQFRTLHHIKNNANTFTLGRRPMIVLTFMYIIILFFWKFSNLPWVNFLKTICYLNVLCTHLLAAPS